MQIKKKNSEISSDALVAKKFEIDISNGLVRSLEGVLLEMKVGARTTTGNRKEMFC